MKKDNKPTPRLSNLLPYLAVGLAFGIIATKSEIISWYRIQEMFRFHDFHMYGVMFSAVIVGALSIWLLKKINARDLGGNPISIPPKELGSGRRYWIGGTLFGVGWALAGACPGPIFALIGNGIAGGVVLFFSALLGTWTYSLLRDRLPH